ncbi:MAG: SCO family protein [Bacteroidota bacterium]
MKTTEIVPMAFRSGIRPRTSSQVRNVWGTLLLGLLTLWITAPELAAQHHGSMQMEQQEGAEHHHHHQDGLEAAEPLSDQSLYQLDRTWTSHRMEPVQLDRFLGHPVIVVMFYGSCTEVCPVLIQDSWRLFQGVDPAMRDQVEVLAVTFDTERDTPERLAEYARNEQLDLPNWHFLTGSERAVRELSMALGVEFRKRSDGMYDHTNLVAVLDLNGEIAERVVGLGRGMESASETIEKMFRENPDEQMHKTGSESMTTAEGDTVLVRVTGTAADARFVPDLLEIRSGTTVQFQVEEGMHTVTAYHPDNRRELRIPDGAPSFDSGPLGEGDRWHLTLDTEGTYNYFCLPHERMGHKGQIRVTGE